MHGGIKTVCLQPIFCHVVTKLWSFAKCEQRFVATHACALFGNGQHLLGTEVWVLQSCRWLGERAVTALVAAQHGERNKHLW